MKQIISFVALLLFVVSLNATAQIDRSKKPEPGPAPKAALPKYNETTLDNGLKVLLVTDRKQPIVRFSLMIKSGSEFDPNGSGDAGFTTSMLTKGTKTRTALQFAQESEFLGINVGAGAADDAMNMGASGLKKHMDKMLEMMTDALLNPTFPQEELDKQQKQSINGLKSSDKSPDAISSRLQITVGYNNHPYSMFETEETIKSLKRDDLVAFHEKYFIPNNSILAVIGDVTMDEVLPVIKKYFGSWKKGTVPAYNFPAPVQMQGKVAHLVDLGKSQTQSTIEVMTPGMKRNDPDYIPLSLANSILGGGFSGRLFQNLREKHSFTYGAYSGPDSRKLAGIWSASASVRRAATDSAIIEIHNEMRRMMNEPVSDEELTMHKQYASGTFLLSLENPGTMASRLMNIDLYSLPKDYYDQYVPKMLKVSKDDIQRVSKKYLDPDKSAITAVGDADEIKPMLERIATVKMYDIHMKPIVEEPTLAIDIDAETLVQKLVKATGGMEAIKAVKDRTIDAALTIAFGSMKREGTFKEVRALPNKRYTKLDAKMFGMEEWCDGSAYTSEVSKKKTALEGEDLQKKLENEQFNEMIRLKELGYKYAVTVKKVEDGKTVYYLKVTKKLGSETWIIDAETFLQVGLISVGGSDKAAFTEKRYFSDFKPVDGVMLPHAIRIEQGTRSYELKVNSYAQNTNPAETTFVKN